VTNQKLTLEDG